MNTINEKPSYKKLQFTLGVWCLTPLSVKSWRGKPEKTTDLPQVIDKLYPLVVLSTSRHERNSNTQL